MVPITHEQTIICSKTRLDGTTHEQTIICRQLFVGHVVGCRPMEGKKQLHRMITAFKANLARRNNIGIGTRSVQELFFVTGAFVEHFTVMICLRFVLVAMYNKKETGNLLYIRCYIGNGKIAT